MLWVKSLQKKRVALGMGKKRWRRGSVEWTAGESGDQQLRVFFLRPEQLRVFFLWPEQLRGLQKEKETFAQTCCRKNVSHESVCQEKETFTQTWSPLEGVALKSVASSGGNLYSDRVL